MPNPRRCSAFHLLCWAKVVLSSLKMATALQLTVKWPLFFTSSFSWAEAWGKPTLITHNAFNQRAASRLMTNASFIRIQQEVGKKQRIKPLVMWWLEAQFWLAVCFFYLQTSSIWRWEKTTKGSELNSKRRKCMRIDSVGWYAPAAG